MVSPADYRKGFLEMPDFGDSNHFGDRNLQPGKDENSAADDADLLMEQILENLNNTPIGQVLKKIATLPDVRKEKILRVRRQLSENKYDLNERLDVVLEKVLNDLTD